MDKQFGQRNTKIIGRKPMLDALERGEDFEKIWLQRGITGGLEITIRAYAKAHDIPLSVVPKTKLDRLVRRSGNHQGVVGLIRMVPILSWAEWLADLEEDPKSMVLILDGITDVRNLAALCRSAEVFGARHIVLPQRGGALIHEDTIKASAGAILQLKLTRVSSLAVAVEALQMRDTLILSAELGQQPLHDLDLGNPKRIGLILGAEDKGVRPHLSRIADIRVAIRQVGKLDSLNVAVAGGIFLHSLRNKLASE